MSREPMRVNVLGSIKYMINSRNLLSTKILICDHILEKQPVSKKVNYRIRVEIVVRARRL